MTNPRTLAHSHRNAETERGGLAEAEPLLASVARRGDDTGA